MSQVTEQSVRFQTALASIKLIQASAVLDLTEDDFDFLTSNKVWIATDRSRARRCVEACVYGTLDFVGYPRFPAPVEFIAAVIAYYVHPVNIQTACLIMEGAEFTENIINGVERPVKPAELFAFTLRVRAGNTDVLTDAEENVRSEERFSRNAETDLVCRLLLEKKKHGELAAAPLSGALPHHRVADVGALDVDCPLPVLPTLHVQGHPVARRPRRPTHVHRPAVV